MKREIRRICIVTSGYPTPENPTRYTFVDQLACAVADHGVEVIVISPQSLLRTKKFGTKYWVRTTRNGRTIQVIQPQMLRFSSKKVLGYPTGRLTERAFARAVSRSLRKIKEPIDILYGHFLVPAGTTAARMGKKYRIPSVCAFGESSLWSVDSVGVDYTRKKLADLSGVVSVSSHNKRILIENALIEAEKIAVFPNGVDHTLFTPTDRQEARRILGFPQSATIAVYTGAFNYDKGVLRVQEAALQIPELKMVYIGGGKNEPEGENIIFKGRVAHDKVPLYLSAADFFVLPTLAEGCCNAIIEAMACGLPIISSIGAYNDDILSDEYSIRVDPNDVAAISSAMKMLTDNKNKTRMMGESALRASTRFDVFQRGAGILQYMQSILQNERAPDASQSK